MPYAASLHEGSVPHDIANAFGLGIIVEHPGYEGDPWARRVLDQMAEGATY